jgi:hypothetical protein
MAAACRAKGMCSPERRVRSIRFDAIRRITESSSQKRTFSSAISDLGRACAGDRRQNLKHDPIVQNRISRPLAALLLLHMILLAALSPKSIPVESLSNDPHSRIQVNAATDILLPSNVHHCLCRYLRPEFKGRFQSTIMVFGTSHLTSGTGTCENDKFIFKRT